MAPGQFFSQPQIEKAALKLLHEYARKYPQQSIQLPIPVDKIAENLLDLNILWEPISEAQGKITLAKLVAREQLVIFNETRQSIFDETEFLENTTLAHEIGHWILHMERGNWGSQTMLFEETTELEFFVYKNPSNSRDSWDEKNAHRFMGCLLMPQELLTEEVKKTPINDFSSLYRLRDKFEVTVTALTIRLEELKLAFIDADGRFHQGRTVDHGQAVIW